MPQSDLPSPVVSRADMGWEQGRRLSLALPSAPASRWWSQGFLQACLTLPKCRFPHPGVFNPKEKMGIDPSFRAGKAYPKGDRLTEALAQRTSL